MKMVFYVLIGAGVFAAAYLAQAFFGVSLGKHTTSSLEPTGFALSRFLLQTLAGGLVGLVIGVIERWRSARKRGGREDRRE